MIAPFHRLRQGEEGLGAGVGGRDQRRVEPVLVDDGEAVALEGGAEPVCEAVEILLVQRQGHGFDGHGRFSAGPPG